MSVILICDDEKDIVATLRVFLSAEGYELREAGNGREALDIINCEKIDLVLLDVMMPEMDGYATIKKIREKHNMPVIFLTAKGESADKIVGLKIGADDYVTKPFNAIELVARVESNLRRYFEFSGNDKSNSVLTNGGLRIDIKSRSVYLDGKKITLTPKEYKILKFFMEHLSEVFSPSELYTCIWEENVLDSENTVMVHIRHLREKIEVNPTEPHYITTVWGQGYMMEAR